LRIDGVISFIEKYFLLSYTRTPKPVRGKMDYDVDVEFLTDTADGQAAIHLEKVQSFKAMDVTVFIGGGWSSQAQAALSYVNDNDMLMISSSSTSPLLAIPNDRLFRTCPTDYVQGPAIANMWRSWGVEAILIVQRGDSWADGIYNVLLPELEIAGIEVVDRVRYAAEVAVRELPARGSPDYNGLLARDQFLKLPCLVVNVDNVVNRQNSIRRGITIPQDCRILRGTLAH